MKHSELNQNTYDRLHLIVTPLLAWYDAHARILPWRDDPNPYSVWISEIMLQQTRVEAVKPYFDRWLKAFPDLASLAAATETEVLKQWEGLGYYSRAKNIHKTAVLVTEQYGGRIPSSFEELRKLPGIGEYTAGSVGSIAFGLPVPCVDGNVLRVVTRLTAESMDIATAAAKKLITGWVNAIIPKDRPGDFNQAMMELGATVCLPNGLPKCELCPVSFLCEAYRQGRISEFPVKTGKAPRKQEKKTILVIINETDAVGAVQPEHSGPHGALQPESSGSHGALQPESPDSHRSPPYAGSLFRTVLRQRPDSGLLAGLWEFPNFDGELSEPQIHAALGSLGLNAVSLTKLKNSKHIFTHIEWEMTGYLVFADQIQESLFTASGFEWVEPDRAIRQLALPAAFKAYYPALKQFISDRPIR